MASRIQQQCYRVLTKKHKLAISKDALEYLYDIVQRAGLDGGEELNEALEYIASSYLQHEGGDYGRVVDRTRLQTVVENIFKKSNAHETAKQAFAQGATENPDNPGHNVSEASAYLQIINGFDVPKYIYDWDRKTFMKPVPKGSKLNQPQPTSLFANAESKTSSMRDRFDLLRQRILRNDSFRPPPGASVMTAVQNGTGKRHRMDYFEITSIKNLTGRTGQRFLLFGMLTQMEEGRHYLEDADAYMELQFVKTMQQTVGLFTYNCFVLVEGIFTEEKKFQVHMIGLPPPEERHKSLSAFATSVDFFGSRKETDDVTLIAQVEAALGDVAFILLSDVWLDQPRVLAKLRQLFEGYSQTILPLAFVFMGNFSSKAYAYNTADAKSYRDGFNALCDIITDYDNIAQQCHFLFVPGPNDPWAGNVLPRPPIPDIYTGRMRARVVNSHFTMNPCRIKYCTQEIVVFREDLLNKMRRNVIIPPDMNQDIEIRRHLVRTIIDQAHLCPLPIHVRPVYWDLDHVLRIYPQPHALVLGDSCGNYAITYEGCHCVNPGSFANNGFGFLVYYPATRHCQESKIPSS
ncbi:DNA-directed DNA polymerase [Synchytrium endobioticum]|uniref:DNA polymerase epsilon subunit n=1 Tax=Synchytrium endobioticum TaxID=286115 RepID=A0A507DK80_9FUNG|nr:DNA-directed DNA polymerase [Synchytrium endobioticum]TPX54451.1 DNA-directed DNA polymerase [Synchytrium endobioticum]